MARVKFYTDEHVPSAVIHGLRLRGVDILTTQDAGQLGASDAAQLRQATDLQRVFVTQDSDFLALHQQGVSHAGLAYAPQWTSIGDLVRGLLLIDDVLTAEEMIGHVEFV